MKKIGFYLFYITNWVMTLMPLSILYIFSDIAFFFIYYFPSYRRKIVALNLKNSFPDKTPGDLSIIERKFYRHLADIFIESLKLTHISDKEMKKRYVLTNPEILQKYKAEGRDIAAICGHYNNWEWMSATPLYTDIKCVTIYKPLRNKYFDKFVNDLRMKKGFFLTPMSNILREIITDRNRGINAMYSFIADQSPARGDIHYWTQFLNQDTPVYTGVEKIAAKYDMVVVYFNLIKVKRGYYNATAEVLFDHTKGLPDYTVTEAHVRCLEKQIREQPECWIWSHHRWKHKREQENV